MKLTIYEKRLKVQTFLKKYKNFLQQMIGHNIILNVNIIYANA